MEMDPKTSTGTSISATEESDMSTNGTTSAFVDNLDEDKTKPIKKEKAPSVATSPSNISLGSGLIEGDEPLIKREEVSAIDPSSKEAYKDRKSSAHSKHPPGKKKAKVDWTPELHRKFVQAVEQLGLDKAVPSRILELMGTDCLTRHNVASHLQKYRSHRKHVVARETGETSWNLRRKFCGTNVTRAGKRDANSWIVPSMGFPPATPMPHYGPLHVWGHPSVDQSSMYMWSSPPSAPHWNPPPVDPWYYHHQDVPATGMPCFPPHFAPTRFPAPPIPGISPTPIYRVDLGVCVPTIPNGQTVPQTPCDFQPSKESIDSVIDDVLSKPWLPLPLGLNPPSIDSVIVELQRQGISKIPPTCA